MNVYDGLRYSINKHLLKILHAKTSELKNIDSLTFFRNSAKICSLLEKKPTIFSIHYNINSLYSLYTIYNL